MRRIAAQYVKKYFEYIFFRRKTSSNITNVDDNQLSNFTVNFVNDDFSNVEWSIHFSDIQHFTLRKVSKPESVIATGRVFDSLITTPYVSDLVG